MNSTNTFCFSVDSLTLQLSDARDEIKTLKRRHAANVKDLSRQLQQTRKRLEQTDNKSDRDSASMGSRTSSVNSLDCNNTTGVASREENTPQVCELLSAQNMYYCHR